MKPVLQAMVLADHVYQDKNTGKRIIAGTFNQITVKRRAIPSIPQDGDEASNAESLVAQKTAKPIPAADVEVLGSPWLYVSFTDAAGDVSLQIRFVDLSDYRVIFNGGLDFTGCEKLKTHEAHAPLPPLHPLVDKPGSYAVELLWRDEPLGSWRVQVIETNTGE